MQQDQQPDDDGEALISRTEHEKEAGHTRKKKIK